MKYVVVGFTPNDSFFIHGVYDEKQRSEAINACDGEFKYCSRVGVFKVEDSNTICDAAEEVFVRKICGDGYGEKNFIDDEDVY